MSIDARKQQKKQARHTAKRKTKQQALVRAKHLGLRERLAAAEACPILHCTVNSAIWTNGMGWVCISRELPSGMVAFGVFLVDRYCLGVKNAWGDVVGRSAYDEKVVRKLYKDGAPQLLTPAAARKLVEGAIAYAQALGQPPHADYHKCQPIFGDIDSSACAEEFEYGMDGQPYFFAGPNDTPEKCRRILHALEKHCGADGFHFTLPFSREFDTVLPEAVRGRPARVIGADANGIVRDYPELLEVEDASGQEERA